MTSYISAIPREFVNSLFAHGFLRIPVGLTAQTTGGKQGSFYALVRELLKNLPLFIWETDYVIISWASDAKKSSENQYYKIDLEQITAITPLSEMAADFLSARWDPRLRLNKPLSNQVLREIRTQNLKDERRKALEILWKILGVSKPFEPILEILGEQNLIEGLMRRIEPDITVSPEARNYWSSVLAYDRHRYYPNNIAGFFFDAGEVLAISRGIATEYPNTVYYRTLNGIIKKIDELTLKNLLEELENNKEFSSYITMTTFDPLRAYRITPVYFMLRQSILDENYNILESTLVKSQESLRKLLQEDFEVVLVLLAYFLGYEKLAPCYFEIYPPRIFNGIGKKLSTLSKSQVRSTAIIEHGSIPEVPADENKPESIQKASAMEVSNVEPTPAPVEDTIQNPGSAGLKDLVPPTSGEEKNTLPSQNSSSEPVPAENTINIPENEASHPNSLLPANADNQIKTEASGALVMGASHSEKIGEIPDASDSEKSLKSTLQDANHKPAAETSSPAPSAPADIRTQLILAAESFLKEKNEATVAEIRDMLNTRFNSKYSITQITNMLKEDKRFHIKKVKNQLKVFLNPQKNLPFD